MCLFKCITVLLPENHLSVNVLNSQKNSWNLQKNYFILLILHFEPTLVRKSYFQSDLRFQDCLITRWLDAASILVVISRIYRYHFKSNYLKNHKPFALLCWNDWNLHELSNVLQKKTSLIAQVFLNLLTPKDVLIQMHHRASFWKPFGSERVN